MKRAIILWIIAIVCISGAAATLYDDFESGINGQGKWNISGTVTNPNFPSAANKSAYLATSAQLKINQSIGLNTGKVVLEYYVHFNTSIDDGMQQDFDTTPDYAAAAFALNPGHPTDNVWGYYNGGWVSSGVPSNSGFASASSKWLRVRVLIDNDNDLFSVKFANSNNISMNNISMAAGKNPVFWRIRGGGAEHGYVDQISYWDFDTLGWTGVSGEVTYMQLTLKTLNGTDINIFNATINGTFYSTTNGTIITGYDVSHPGIVNITYRSPNFFNSTYHGISTANDHTGKVFNGQIYFTPRLFLTGGVIHNGSFKSNFNTSYYHDSRLEFVNGTWTVTFNKTGYYSKSQAVTVAMFDNRSVNITGIYTHLLNISTTAAAGGTVENFTINVTLINSSLTTNPFSQLYTTTSGYVPLGLIPGNYSVFIDTTANNPDYAMVNATINLQYTLQNYTFSLYGTNSFNIIFKNEKGFSTMNGINISVEFISDDDAAGPYYTTNASIFKDGLTPGEYIIRYSAANFAERSYYVTLINQTTTNLTLYLLNKTKGTNVSVTVYDSMGRQLESATVKALKYDVNSNSYILVAMSKTNFEGAGYLDLELNTEYYKFIILYDGITRKITTPSYIFAEAITFRIDIGSTIAQQFYFSQGIIRSLTFNNNTNLITYTWDDASGLVSKSCLYVYHDNYLGRTLTNSTCVYSASGSIFIGVVNVTGDSIIGEAYITSGGENFLIATVSHTYQDYGASLGGFGLIIVLIITIVLAIAGFSWNAAAGLIVTPLPLLIASITGVIPLGIGYIAPVYLFILVVVYVISDQA